MKRIGALTCVAVSLFAALVFLVPLAAQGQPQKAQPTHYTVQDLGTLGGTFSVGYGINNVGSVVRIATLPGDTAKHAFLWRKGKMIDLGTLGGPNSSPVFRHNDKDEVVGAAEISTPDPLGEDWCGFGTHLVCVPFFWKDGVMTALPTLGGNNGQATSINNLGHVVGVVENSTPSNCLFSLQVGPVRWDHGQIAELPLLAGDTQGNANWINDRGQAVGFSLTPDCGPFHVLLWENGMVTDLGGLGGTFNNAISINNRGQVCGVSNLPGDVTGHAYLWQKSFGMKDLGTLPGDFSSWAWAMDNQGRVVGQSCDESGNCRAFLWQNDVMRDLNSLIADESSWFLPVAEGVNARGEITGAGFNTITGEVHAVLLTPDGEALAGESNRPRPKVVLPEHVRKLLQGQLARRYQRFGDQRALAP